MTDWVATTVMIVSFAMLLLNSFMTIYNLVQKGKEPTKQLEVRIDNLEDLVNSRFKEYDHHFDKDLRRIEDLESGTIVTLQSLQALLRHGIDGNNTAGLKDADKELSAYLIKRGARS